RRVLFRSVDIGTAEERDEQREPYTQQQPHEEHGHREREARPRALANAVDDRRIVGVALAEVEGQHAAKVVDQHVVGGLGQRGPLGLVVAVALLPLLDHLDAHLFAQRAASDVVRLGDREKEEKQQKQHTEDGDDAVAQSSENVGEHACYSYCRSLKKVMTPGTMATTNTSPIKNAGHSTGVFHSLRFLSRSTGSMSRYLNEGSDNPAGLTFFTQEWTSAYS